MHILYIYIKTIYAACIPRLHQIAQVAVPMQLTLTIPEVFGAASQCQHGLCKWPVKSQGRSSLLGSSANVIDQIDGCCHWCCIFKLNFILILIFVYFASAPNEADVSGAMAHIRGISMALSDSFATTRFSYVDMVLLLHCSGSPLKSMGLEEIYLMWFDSEQMVDMILYMNQLNHMIWNLLNLLTLMAIISSPHDQSNKMQ